ncbi:MAG: HPF/RaiA family ribosome-associated protein [Anaerolineales bacterium]
MPLGAFIQKEVAANFGGRAICSTRGDEFHRVEAAFDTPRRTFRAHADAPDVEAALDAVVEKLERQLRDHREKRRAKLIAGASRVKSANNREATSE